MNTNNNIAPDSRVWVYQSNRELTASETETLKKAALNFVAGWTAHEMPLDAGAEIFYNRFLVLMVDEKQAGASGCSIDKSVKFIKEAEANLGITLMDRMNLAYKEGDKVLSCSKAEFEQLMLSGKINDETIVFNNLVGTKAELDTNWEIPLANSWHKNLV